MPGPELNLGKRQQMLTATDALVVVVVVVAAMMHLEAASLLEGDKAN